MEALMFLLKSFLLGIVEGITEFLPVSSTGHMIIVEHLVHFTSKSDHYVETYTYVIQLGAILAIVVLYWKKLWGTVVHLFPRKGQVTFLQSGLRFWLMIVLACVPGLLAELTFGDRVEAVLFRPEAVALTLFFGGILMLVMEQHYREKSSQHTLELSVSQALMIGCFQCLAVLPGMSRSASTIMGGWCAGLATVSATEFSFFLAIPVMLGMSFLKLWDIGGFTGMTSMEMIALGIGFLVSFAVALIVVEQFIAYLKNKPMKVFAYYRMIFAACVLLMGFLGAFPGPAG